MGLSAAQDLRGMVGGIHIHRLARVQRDLHGLSAGDSKAYLSGAQGYRDHRGVRMLRGLIARVAAELQDPDTVVLFRYRESITPSKYPSTISRPRTGTKLGCSTT